jgi:hypothetical protein
LYEGQYLEDVRMGWGVKTGKSSKKTTKTKKTKKTQAVESGKWERGECVGTTGYDRSKAVECQQIAQAKSKEMNDKLKYLAERQIRDVAPEPSKHDQPDNEHCILQVSNPSGSSDKINQERLTERLVAVPVAVIRSQTKWRPGIRLRTKQTQSSNSKRIILGKGNKVGVAIHKHQAWYWQSK